MKILGIHLINSHLNHQACKSGEIINLTAWRQRRENQEINIVSI